MKTKAKILFMSLLFGGMTAMYSCSDDDELDPNVFCDETYVQLITLWNSSASRRSIHAWQQNQMPMTTNVRQLRLRFAGHSKTGLSRKVIQGMDGYLIAIHALSCIYGNKFSLALINVPEVSCMNRVAIRHLSNQIKWMPKIQFI